MLVKKKDKSRNKKKPLNRLAVLLILISYSSALVLITLNRNNIGKKFLTSIPLGTKQIIKDAIPYQFYRSGFKVNVLNNLIKGALQKVDPIVLDIKYKQFDKLQKKRNDAIKRGLLITSNDDYVNALISDSDKKLKAKIRLKGDYVDHLQSDKWSFRIKIEEDNTLLGMNKFSLQSPVTRNYIWEWLFHEILRYEGLPSLRYFFRPLIINGDYRGIYAIEEHFDKIFLESNSFKEAPILKFSETLMWEQKNKINNEKYRYRKSFSTGFKLNKISKNPTLKMNFETANQLLNGFQEGIFTTSEVFDIEYLAKYFAIVDLLNAGHASNWHNIRFYFDPFQTKLIPIGYDADANEKLLEGISIEESDEFRNSIFKDDKFTKLYIRNLKRISNKEYLDNFFKIRNKLFTKNKNILFKSFPALDTSTDNLYKNQLKIRNILEAANPINAFLEGLDLDEINLTVANNQSLPLLIKGVKINNQIFKIKNEFILKGIKIDQRPIYENLKIPIKNIDKTKFNQNKDIYLIYKIYGLNKSYLSKINLFSRKNPSDLKYEFSKTFNIRKQPFLKVNEEEKKILIKKGRWIINNPLIIPKGYKFIANAGVKLDLVKDGFILSYSPVFFRGSVKNPIEIKNFDKSKGNGFGVINANSNSIIENVIFKNMNNIENKRFIFTGGVTFYQSPIKIKNSIFENSMSEDSLNIVRSDFEISNTLIRNSFSDGIDIDFSNGGINNVEINNSNNDGLDISGSIIKATDLIIDKAKDKGLSIGESSNTEFKRIIINNTFVGIANKDGSNSIIRNSNINNSEYDFIGFNKKNEYSGSNTKIEFLKTDDNSFNYLLANPSSLTKDNFFYEPNSENNTISELIYR